ncbi:nucleic acid-binding protein [Methylobacterium sp. Leaf361]|uniref:nucleic acid-binding protein n=1 Tax=Methylobacterium sp. Leaf361 TaxID=1736352 RepID=UPI000ADDD523|nr:nucleic acid-binding protein [Methylobacterium sp. Leaf361]
MIFLDTNLLWWVAHPAGGPDAELLREKLKTRLNAGEVLAVAEICDYEARRELLRKNATGQLGRLDRFIGLTTYVPINTAAMRTAAILWANLRNAGRQLSPDDALDGDVILAAQAGQYPGHVVATKNLKHLTQICNAIDWRAL